jgi:pyruvate/2-oxoglutarate/acetoin dehydrogenase E1 component
MEKSQEAIAALKGEVGVELIDLRSIVPWDKTIIEASVRRPAGSSWCRKMARTAPSAR